MNDGGWLALLIWLGLGFAGAVSLEIWLYVASSAALNAGIDAARRSTDREGDE